MPDGLRSKSIIPISSGFKSKVYNCTLNWDVRIQVQFFPPDWHKYTNIWVLVTCNYKQMINDDITCVAHYCMHDCNV